MSSPQAERITRRADRALAGLENAAIARVRGSLQLAYDRLERELIRALEKYSEGNYPNLAAADRAALVLQQIQQYLQIVAPDEANAIAARFASLFADAAATGGELSERLIELVEVGSSPDQFTNAVSDVYIEAIAATATDSVERLKNHEEKFRDGVIKIVGAGIAAGDGPDRMARQIASQFEVLRHRAEAIARTETIGAFDAANQRNYIENDIRYVMRMVTEDNRLCPFCAARAGNVYRVGEAPALLHPNDRCYNAPYDPDDPEQKRWARQHRRGAIAALPNNVTPARRDAIAPFEALNGRLPPIALWTPED